MKGITPSAEPARLQVFISYATEDENLARAISDELRKAFSPTILKVLIAAEFGLGTAWRQALEDDLNSTDILLIVATGLQKLSHSFTGFEVGYFKGSKKYRPQMAHFKSDRLIIPIAIATNIPDPVVDIQSLQLEGPLDPLIMEQGILKNQQKFLDTIGYASNKNPLLKLFKRIQSVIRSSFPFNDDELASFDEQIQGSSKRLHELIFAELRKRISTENFPERKIIVRVEANPTETPMIRFRGPQLSFLGGHSTFSVSKCLRRVSSLARPSLRRSRAKKSLPTGAISFGPWYWRRDGEIFGKIGG
jgi:TIR domain